MEQYPVTKQLIVYKNTTKSYELNFTKDDKALNITGWTIYFTVKENIDDDDNDAVIKKDITSHSDPTGGTTFIVLTTDDTNREGNFHYDIKYKDSDGNSDILVKGKITFEKTVTQRDD